MFFLDSAIEFRTVGAYPTQVHQANCTSQKTLSNAAQINPSNAEATYVQSTRMQCFLNTILTLSCWYSLDSSRWVLSDEYPFARFFVLFFHHFVLAKAATTSIRVRDLISV